MSLQFDWTRKRPQPILQNTAFPSKRQLQCLQIRWPESLMMKITQVDEQREIIIGHSVQQNLILVSFTGDEDQVRLLSARKAARTERKDYEENVGS